MTAAPVLVLGTAQWGMAYGVANRHGVPGDRELRRILRVARQGGITTLDTAAMYGDSEMRIGNAVGADSDWRVVTKLAPGLASVRTPEAAARLVADGLAGAMRRLQRTRLDAVLLHRPEDLHAHGGVIWAALREARAAGIVDAIGVSVVDARDATECVTHDGVEIVQLAVSLFDRRALEHGVLRCARERSVAVLGRSTFLQGAALLDPGVLPPYLTQLAEPLRRLRTWCAQRDRTLASTLLAWVLALPLDGVVVGVERAEQVEEHLRERVVSLTMAERGELVALVGHLPESILDPWRWPTDGSEPAVTLRLADHLGDVDLLLSWRNDPDTRAASFTTDVVLRAEHEAWVSRRRADPESSLLVAEVDDGAVGVVRIERATDGRGAEVHFTIAPERRGEGLALPVLLAALEHARELGLGCLDAAVRSGNERSLRTFRAAGFVEIARSDDRVDLRADLSSSGVG